MKVWLSQHEAQGMLPMATQEIEVGSGEVASNKMLPSCKFVRLCADDDVLVNTGPGWMRLPVDTVEWFQIPVGVYGLPLLFKVGEGE